MAHRGRCAVNYNEALEYVGRSFLVSYAGGRSRYATFRREGDTVIASLMGHDIVTFYPNGRYRVTTAGHNTPSTVDALNALDPMASYYNRAGELYRQGERLWDDSLYTHAGGVLERGEHLAPVRGVDSAIRTGDIIDVFTYGRARLGVAKSAAARLLEDGERLEVTLDHPGEYTFRVLS
jgi:hypothetical protein